MASAIHIEPPDDADEISGELRNRATRVLSGLLTSTAIFVAPTALGWGIGTLVSFAPFIPLSPLAPPILAAAGLWLGVSFFKRISKRLFVYNEEWTGYVTQDPLSGSNVPYGPGWHFAHWWEQRNQSGEYDLHVKTVPFSIAVPTKTAQVVVTGNYQYAIRLWSLIQFIGSGRDTVEKGLTAFIEQQLTQQLTQKDAESARNEVKTVNENVSKVFIGSNASGGYEVQYGITIANIVISKIALSDEAQKTRDSEDEADALAKTVAKIAGYSAAEYLARRADGRINDKQHMEFYRAAMGVSGNASYAVHAIEGGGNVTPMIPLNNP